jgi:hypothetical protein
MELLKMGDNEENILSDLLIELNEIMCSEEKASKKIRKVQTAYLRAENRRVLLFKQKLTS